MPMDAETQAAVQDDAGSVEQSRLQGLLGYQLTRAQLQLHRRLVERLQAVSLRPVEYSILVLIDSNHGINQRQIGDALGISPPNLVGVITRLIKRRLVRRARSRQDRRVQHLHLTAEGARLLVEAEGIVTEFEQGILAAIGDVGQDQLERALRRIQQL